MLGQVSQFGPSYPIQFSLVSAPGLGDGRDGREANGRAAVGECLPVLQELPGQSTPVVEAEPVLVEGPRHQCRGSCCINTIIVVRWGHMMALIYQRYRSKPVSTQISPCPLRATKVPVLHS
jgi:hypothetical protein